MLSLPCNHTAIKRASYVNLLELLTPDYQLMFGKFTYALENMKYFSAQNCSMRCQAVTFC